MNYKASIIIPTFSRFDLLDKALKSLVKQDFLYSDFEIIVVDNGSTDNTQETVQRYIEKNKKHTIRYIFDDVPGLLTGRHRGAQEAHANILCFLDDDIEATSNWLQEVYNTFEDPTIQLVGGKCLPIYDVTPPVWEKKLWSITNDYKMCGYYSLIDQGDEFKDCDPNLIWGLFFCIRKQTLYNAGGFHADVLPNHLMRFLGDGETGITMKIKELGLRSVYQPKAVLYHHVTKERLTVDYLKKRQFYQGCCNSYTEIRKNNGLVKPKQTVRQLTLRILAKHLLSMLFRYLKMLKRVFLHKVIVDEFEIIQLEMNKSYNEGYFFHQNEAKNDPELVKWFLQEDYFDYRLPIK